MRQPHNNVAASKQWGCLTSLRLPHNIVAASQQWVCLTTMRLLHNNKAASQQWGCLTTMLMPNNSIATSQQRHCLTTMRLPPNEVSPWLWGLLFGLPHSNKFLTAFRTVAGWCGAVGLTICTTSSPIVYEKLLTNQSEILCYDFTSMSTILT